MEDKENYDVSDDLPEIGCFRCGICCVRYSPKVTKTEMKNIARVLVISVLEFLTKYVKTVPTKDGYILQNSDDSCPFLRWDEKDNKATCSIYSVRPKVCRTWVASLSCRECREGLARTKTAESP